MSNLPPNTPPPDTPPLYTPPQGAFTENVIPTLLQWRLDGLEAALLTLVRIEGTSPRPLGSQMAVNERGDWVGNITSGCAEAALAAEAVQALTDTSAKLERYGRGSRYVDIQLPCGSGIDVYFDPAIATSVLRDLMNSISSRLPCALAFDLTLGTDAHSAVVHAEDGRAPQTTQIASSGAGLKERVVRPYLPTTRIHIAGKGPAVGALAQIAAALGWQVIVSSPDRGTLASVAPHADQTHHLDLPKSFDAHSIDPWTATVLLFHDHDWEPPILHEALQRDGFYVGAMGSRQTHRHRCAALQSLGCTPEQLARIHAPIGLDIGAHSPPEIALAIAAEIQSCVAANVSTAD